MTKKQYIIYCDESTEKGRYYSHFYGGALIPAQYREAITRRLNSEKRKLNLHKEVKWTYITENYAAKYIRFMDIFFDLVEAGQIKIRIMFSQNIYRPTDLSEYQVDNQYFLLYYQLIKHAFGLRYCNPAGGDEICVSLYLDDIPDTKEKFRDFKNYLHALCFYPVFKRARIMIPKENITDVRSHEHVILQGLDIVLGAMQFRLNDLHKQKPAGAWRRAKRTRAKERVYKHINERIRRIYPNFNIGVSTGTPAGDADRWHHPYRHWCFIPSEHKVDTGRGKKHIK